MELLTPELLAEFEKQGNTGNKRAENIKVITKFFMPDGAGKWFITDWLPEDDVFFGYCSLGNPDFAELGYVSKTELESLRGHLGMPVERDLHWDSNTTLREVMDKKGVGL